MLKRKAMEAERELDDLYYDLWDDSYDKVVVATSDDLDDEEEERFFDVARITSGSFRRIEDL